jgi:hypothetical protein
LFRSVKIAIAFTRAGTAAIFAEWISVPKAKSKLLLQGRMDRVHVTAPRIWYRVYESFIDHATNDAIAYTGTLLRTDNRFHPVDLSEKNAGFASRGAPMMVWAMSQRSFRRQVCES